MEILVEATKRSPKTLRGIVHFVVEDRGRWWVDLHRRLVISSASSEIAVMIPQPGGPTFSQQVDELATS